MSDIRTGSSITGSRDDLRINSSRCLRMRFSGSSCSRCTDICPRGAIDLEDSLSIDRHSCSGCLLCSTVCPSGALEQRADFSVSLAKLSTLPEPVLGCLGTQERSHANMACLGGLSEEHLIALYAGTRQIQLDITTCSGCSNLGAVNLLRERLADLEGKTGMALVGKIRLVEKTTESAFRREAIGRRGFFKALTGSLLKETSALLQPTKAPIQNKVSYTEKQLSQRSWILEKALAGLSSEEQQGITQLFKCEIERSDDCDGCAACSKVCPTGAMAETTNADVGTVAHDPLHCTGCGLCIEFCLNEALKFKAM